jgi:predicted nucleic acid-binding protein
MKYIFDTTVYSELLRGHKEVATILRDATEVLMPNVVKAELQYGFHMG